MKRKHLTVAEYDTIKQLTGMSLRIGQVAEIVKRSKSTVSFIKRSDSYDGYMDIIHAYIAKSKEKIVPGLEQEQKAEDEYMASGKSVVSELTRIADAMERLATAWENKPKRPFGL